MGQASSISRKTGGGSAENGNHKQVRDDESSGPKFIQVREGSNPFLDEPPTLLSAYVSLQKTQEDTILSLERIIRTLENELRLEE